MSDAQAPTARLAVLLSGGGRTMVNLAERIDAGELDAEIGLVIASRPCAGADRARERGFETLVLESELDATTFERRLSDRGIAWAVLAGFTRLVPIPENLRGRVTNIHPALLPLFGGRGMYGDRVHRAVLDSGMKVSGCTVHLCDDRYDTGPIILQRCCPVLEDDNVATLAARVFEVEKEAYPEALRMLLGGRVTIEDHVARLRPS